jgi:endoglycosylceramidase
MLDHLATRFAGDNTILGYELLNEPLAVLDELTAFHREMIASLRPTAPDKLIFFESIAYRNVLDSTIPGDGSLGPGTVYAPHVYTGVFAPAPRPLTKEILSYSNASARDESDGWEAPLAITEWGFGPYDAQYAEFVQWQQELQDQYLASSFYWVWKEYGATSWGFYSMDEATGVATPRTDTIAQFSRLRPEAIAGTITSTTYDPTTRTLEVAFTGRADVTAANRISLAGAAALDATCDGAPVATSVSGATAGVDCSGAGSHVLRATAR